MKISRPLLLLTIALVSALVIVAGGSIYLNWQRPPSPEPAGAPWTTVELPEVGAEFMRVLRAKTTAGQDRFQVELLGEKINAQLGVLKKFFKSPAQFEID